MGASDHSAGPASVPTAAPSAPYVFGLDGGGTSSRLRIADRSNAVVLELAGEGVNPNAVDRETLALRLEGLFRGVRDNLGPAGLFAAGCAAVAGMEREPEQGEFERILRDRLGFTCPLVLVSDPIAALVGGLESPEGMILIAGTGSIALARLSDGRRFRAGGYGHYLSDEGSAFFIGFQALRRGIRSGEGRDLPTAFLEDLLAFYGLSAAQDAIAFVYSRFDKAAIAKAATLIAGYRDRGDELAIDIYREAVTELVALAASAAAAAGPALAHRDLLLWGGLFEHDPWLAEEVVRELGKILPVFTVRRALHDAAYGACMLALEKVR